MIFWFTVAAAAAVVAWLWLAGSTGDDARETAEAFHAALERGDVDSARALLDDPGAVDPAELRSWADSCEIGTAGSAADQAVTSQWVAGGHEVTIDAPSGMVTYRVAETAEGWRITEWSERLACSL